MTQPNDGTTNINGMIDTLRSAGWLVKGPAELWFTADWLGGALIMYGAEQLGIIQSPPMATDEDEDARLQVPWREDPDPRGWRVLCWQPDEDCVPLTPVDGQDFETEAEAREAIAAALTPMIRYYFTFGSGQLHASGYHVIDAADWAAARRIMFERFGTAWCGQYSDEPSGGCSGRWTNSDGTTQAERYDLHEVFASEGDNAPRRRVQS